MVECFKCHKPIDMRTSTPVNAWIHTVHPTDHNSARVVCNSCTHTVKPGTTFQVNKSRRGCSLELEFFGPEPTRENSQYLGDLGILKPDGSLHLQPSDAFGVGMELNTYPTSGDSLLLNVHSAVHRIKVNNGFVNKTCGIHLHFDLTGSTAQQRTNLYEWWAQLEPIFFLLVAPQRHTNNFCVPSNLGCNNG